jgi:hypothetical protein
MPKPEIEFRAVDDIPWQRIPDNDLQWQKILAMDEFGNGTRLLRFDPGCRTRDVLRHDFWEEIWILEGSLTDLRLGETFTAGMYACRPPGMPHGPWEAPQGCVTFEVRYAEPDAKQSKT